MDMTRVTEFWENYKTKSATNPNLYISGNSLNVILPNNLLEYANAAAGHSGFGAGARARGIRRSVDNAQQAIKDIFETPQSLAKFLESSEKNADAYVEGIRARDLGTAIDQRSANDSWSELYAKYDINTLANTFGRNAVIDARKLLTVNEFELRFGLALAA